MRILIELPTWLGDAVMVSPALENIIQNYNNPEITIIGSMVSTEAIRGHPMVVKSYVLKKNYLSLFSTVQKLGKFDAFFSFRSSTRSRIFKFLVNSKYKFQYKNNKYQGCHQVEKYNRFVNECVNNDYEAGKLKIFNIHHHPSSSPSKLLGINPGASYGEAKQWYPQEFAKVAAELSEKYDIQIFGGLNDEKVAKDIEKILIEKKVVNFENFAGKTSVPELINFISNLDLFITGDSGPMHLAASFDIPTVTIFGPTNDIETSQWMNKDSVNIKKNLDCQPCMSRTCPLNHHNCMKQIKANEVLEAVEFLKNSK